MKTATTFFSAILIFYFSFGLVNAEDAGQYVHTPNLTTPASPLPPPPDASNNHLVPSPAGKMPINDPDASRPDSDAAPDYPFASPETKAYESAGEAEEPGTKVKIIKHPEPLRIPPGAPVTFSVKVSGEPPLSFQWKRNHINIQGATSETYTIEAVQKKDEGVYSCDVSNRFSNDISDDAALTIAIPTQPLSPGQSPEASSAVQAEKQPKRTGLAAPAAIYPPKISLHPSDQIKNPGDSVTFSVDVSGTPPLFFQWGKSGKDIDGATRQTYTIDSVAEKDEGIFYCTVTNAAGKLKSDPAWLSINNPASIIHHPVDQSQEPGKPVTFSVTASGDPPLSFQWKKNHIDIQGATSESYTIDAVRKKDEGVYSCEVSNDFSNDISLDATLTLQTQPAVSEQTSQAITDAGFSPDDVSPDSSIILSSVKEEIAADAPGTDGDDQPQADDVFEDQAAEPEKVIPEETAAINPPQILRHPSAQAKNPGDSITFSVEASGTPPLAFQWKKDGSDMPYAILDAITIDPVRKQDEGEYSCEISNAAGAVLSDTALLTVNEPVKISGQPESQTKTSGEAVTFSISVTGTGPFEFQWKKDGSDIPYAVIDSITIDPVRKQDEGEYSCEISNQFSTAISETANLKIHEPPPAAVPPLSEKTDRPAVEAPDGAQPASPPAVESPPDKTTESVSAEKLAPSKPKIPAVKKKPAVQKQVKTPAPDSFALSLSAPDGQHQYVDNGNVITFTGTAVPGIKLQSAVLKDEEGFTIRDIAKGVDIDRTTGRIRGSMFVGSFRRARSVFLHITVATPSGKTLTGASNSLIVDNTDPEIIVRTPSDHAYFKTAPIIIQGTAIDKISGIANIEISVDGGTSYHPVDSYADGSWQFLFTPRASAPLYTIQARTSDFVGHSAISRPLTIYFHPPSRANAPPRSKKKTDTEQHHLFTPDIQAENADKLPSENGICTYRIISLKNNRFQPSDLFTLKEEMAIIIKGYGGKEITLKIIEPSSDKVVFELSDYIPVNKHKMWKWKLSKTGIFKAALFVDGLPQDDVFFKIIQ